MTVVAHPQSKLLFFQPGQKKYSPSQSLFQEHPTKTFLTGRFLFSPTLLDLLHCYIIHSPEISQTRTHQSPKMQTKVLSRFIQFSWLRMILTYFLNPYLGCNALLSIYRFLSRVCWEKNAPYFNTLIDDDRVSSRQLASWSPKASS